MSNMLKHLPDFISKMKVFQEENKALTPELELIKEKIQTLQGNQFINFANANGLSRYEAMFGLEKESTMQKRRVKILAKMQQGANYTYFWLINYLNSVIGETNYTLILSNLELQISVSTRAESYFLNLKKDLRSKIPANVYLDMYLVDDVQQIVYFGGNIRTFTHIRV